jgi:hypothetical protein
MMHLLFNLLRKSAGSWLALLLMVVVSSLLVLPAAAADHSPSLDQITASSGPGETIPVVLYLDSRLSMDDVYPTAKSLPMTARRDYVVKALKARFHEMSGRLMERLDQAVKSGQAAKVRPLWVLNGVRAEVTADLIREIDKDLSEVIYIASDPRYENTLDAVGWGVQEMQAPQIWSQYGDGSGVVVGHKDSGIYLTHPGFAGHIWINPGEDINHDGTIDGADTNGIDDDGNGYVDDFYGWNFDDDNNNCSDRQGHGTRTGSTISAGTSPCDTVSVAPGAKLMVLSCFESQSASWEGSQYAMEMGAQVISQSFSFKYSECAHDGIRECPNYVAHRMVSEMELAAGMLHANSTGNDGLSNPIPMSCSAPSNCPPPAMTSQHPQQGGVSSVIAVAAYNSTGGWESYSGQGPSAWSRQDICSHPRMPFCGQEGHGNSYPADYEDYPYQSGAHPGLLKPDLTAPTVTPSLAMGGGCGSINGTSGATPHVGGACALIYSAFPGITPERTYLLLVNNAVDMGNAGADNVWGFGKVRPLPAIVQGMGILTEVTGYVRYSGVGLAGVRVTTAGANDVITDGTGQYYLYLSNGSHQIRFQKFGYVDREATVNAAGGTVIQDILLDAAQPATVTVTTSLDGGPQSWVWVTVPEADSRMQTGDNGTRVFNLTNTLFTFIYGDLPWDVDTLQVQLAAGSQSITLPLTRSARASLPVGPDAYGYQIFDRWDTPRSPYEWIEINPNESGGWPGATLPVGDDNTSVRTLPFSFQYYGTTYSQISVSANGFIVFGSNSSQEWSAPPIPSTITPNNYVAAFFEDWSPTRGGGVYYYSRPDSHFVVVEWWNVGNYDTTGVATFEAILYDPAVYQTATGDGIIKLQYKRITRLLEGTVGCENANGTDGVQYLYQTNFASNASPIDSGMALIISTENMLDSPDGSVLPAARDYALYPNYPNPFNPSTTFSWSVPRATPVKLALYDILGQEAAVVFDGISEAGVQHKTFDASALATGVYFARLETQGRSLAVRKVLLMK